jgi:hypothetical protein
MYSLYGTFARYSVYFEEVKAHVFSPSQFLLKHGIYKLVGNVWGLVLSEIMIPTIVISLLCPVIVTSLYYFLFYEQGIKFLKNFFLILL